ncbi:S41 family peptidase [Chitinophaga horti]|uniref:S41 family peptidase n=1 Tax=Chitinophaga horti TaxID=2920382 RepID=A0ABY6J2P0_9BACT|nr:S41 family peptidase [Chitinophaga horti]UYQ93775.1 S41 family peptidase [Chitinophaga horti]
MSRFSFLLLIPICYACRKADPPPPAPTGPVTRTEINTWVLDSLRQFYLWSDQLPVRPDASQETFSWFQSLRSPADRFSFMYHPAYDSTQPAYMFRNFGVELSVIQWPAAPGGVLGVVKLVAPDAHPGIQRGTYFTRVDGEVLTANNAAGLLQRALHSTGFAITIADVTADTVTEGNSIHLKKTVYDHPLVHRINGTTAYLFYNSFHDVYNTQLLRIFQSFKTAGVKNLVLDLRYNQGGSVSAAAVLAALIAPGVKANTGFVYYTGNKRLGKHLLSFYDVLDGVMKMEQLTPASLVLPRVYILCGRATASASELLINNLKPFTQVTLIGEKTFGKDEGAITIRDMRNPRRIDWIMVPIAYKLANANGKGDYDNGITPDYVLDEMNEQPLGDMLYQKALSIIAGTGRLAPYTPSVHRKMYETPVTGEPVLLPIQ